MNGCETLQARCREHTSFRVPKSSDRIRPKTDRYDSRPVFAFELPETAAVDNARYDISYIECLANVSANDTM